MFIVSAVRARLCKWLCHGDQDGNVTPPRDPHDPVIRDPRPLREQWLTGRRDGESAAAPDDRDGGRVRVRVVLIAGLIIAVVVVGIAVWNHHSNPDCADVVSLFNCH
jgi:hypothetical protein